MTSGDAGTIRRDLSAIDPGGFTETSRLGNLCRVARDGRLACPAADGRNAPRSAAEKKTANGRATLFFIGVLLSS
jgi:hypothetical protein